MGDAPTPDLTLCVDGASDLGGATALSFTFDQIAYRYVCRVSTFEFGEGGIPSGETHGWWTEHDGSPCARCGHSPE